MLVIRSFPSEKECFKSEPERTTFFKRTFRKDLSYDPEFYEDGTVTWAEYQGPEDVSMYLKSLQKMVTYCLDKMGSSLFQYVGTAATARDLAAMADVFDGPGSQINLWTQAHGSVVVSNLMKCTSPEVFECLCNTHRSIFVS